MATRFEEEEEVERLDLRSQGIARKGCSKFDARM